MNVQLKDDAQTKTGKYAKYEKANRIIKADVWEKPFDSCALTKKLTGYYEDKKRFYY
ncbi:MAG: hypothetical protein HYX40_02295 [Sphingobacteriales bacterium]|nr:hypothetical protein [Sphingobacteriales bacterium]